MKNVHIEGMGCVGSFLAHAFGREGISFTWYDNNMANPGWRYSNGLVLPAAYESENILGYSVFKDFIGEHIDLVEDCEYWYSCGITAPFRTYLDNVDIDPGKNLNRLRYNAIVFDLPTFVDRMRSKYISKMQDEPANSILIKNAYRIARNVKKSWSIDVEFDIPEYYRKSGKRPVFLFRFDDYKYVYASPIIGSPRYRVSCPLTYNFSLDKNLVSQEITFGVPSRIQDMERHLNVKVTQVSPIQVSHRPLFTRLKQFVERRDDIITIRPTNMKGVNCAPMYSQAVIEAIKKPI